MIIQQHSRCVLLGVKAQFSPIAFLQHLKYLIMRIAEIWGDKSTTYIKSFESLRKFAVDVFGRISNRTLSNLWFLCYDYMTQTRLYVIFFNLHSMLSWLIYLLSHFSCFSSLFFNRNTNVIFFIVVRYWVQFFNVMCCNCCLIF